MEQIIFWTGAAVLAAGAAAGAALLFAALVIGAAGIANHQMRRAGNMIENLSGMAAWDRAGRPEVRVLYSGRSGWVNTKRIKRISVAE